jgi:hypothetical protein
MARAADDPAVAALTEPARQRLVVIASDVLGRMAAEEVSTALRAIAKFTPAKRARLGGAVLLEALDVDVDFRQRLAEVITKASPQLADAIRAGVSGVRVLFSAADEIADDFIRRLVAQEPQGRPIVVVTSDEQVVSDVLRAGAWTVPSAVFLARIG